jgi:serine protease
MASPHAAGVAALIVGAGVTDPDAVEAILEETARAPRGGKIDPLKYGAGIIDAPAAVKMARGKTGAFSLGLGVMLLGAMAYSARRRLALGSLAGLVVGASGLFFLPWLGLDSLFAVGVPMWGEGNPLLMSALVPFGLIALLYGVRRFRAPLAGFAAGVAAHLLFQLAARTTDVLWIPGAGGTLDAVWLGVNALVSGVLAYIVVRE